MTITSGEGELQMAPDAQTSTAGASDKNPTSASYQENLSFLRAAEGRHPSAQKRRVEFAATANGPPVVRRFLQTAPQHSRSMESLSSWSSSQHAAVPSTHAGGPRGVCLSSAQAMPDLGACKPGPRSSSAQRLAAASRTQLVDSRWEGNGPVIKDVCDTSTETIFVDPAQRSMGSPSPGVSPARGKEVKVEVTSGGPPSACRARMHLDAEHQQRCPGSAVQTTRVVVGQDAAADLEGPTICSGSTATQAAVGERIPLARHLHSKVGDAWPWMTGGTAEDGTSCSSGAKLLSTSMLAEKQDAGRADAQLVEMLVNEKVAKVVDQRVADACRAIEHRLEEHLNNRFERECLDVCKRLQVDWTDFKGTLEATMRGRRGDGEAAPQASWTEDDRPSQSWQALFEAIQTRHEDLESKLHECDRTCEAMLKRLSQVETKIQSNLLIPVASAATVASTLHKSGAELPTTQSTRSTSLHVSTTDDIWQSPNPYVLPGASDVLTTSKPRASRKSLPARLPESGESNDQRPTSGASAASSDRKSSADRHQAREARGSSQPEQVQPQMQPAHSTRSRADGASAGKLASNEAEWQDRFDRLQERFPNCTAAQVLTALREHKGHAGQAAAALRDL